MYDFWVLFVCTVSHVPDRKCQKLVTLCLVICVFVFTLFITLVGVWEVENYASSNSRTLGNLLVELTKDLCSALFLVVEFRRRVWFVVMDIFIFVGSVTFPPHHHQNVVFHHWFFPYVDLRWRLTGHYICYWCSMFMFFPPAVCVWEYLFSPAKMNVYLTSNYHEIKLYLHLSSAF